jgi:membrane protein
VLSGVLAGVVAGTVYQLLQWLYIEFQVGVASYNAVYGSFAALPLFLLWVQLSWLVVLLGAEIAFSWQNAETFELEPDSLRTSRRFKLLLALRTTHLLVKSFLSEQGPLSAQAIGHRLEIPVRLVNELLFELAAAGIVAENRLEGSEETSYQIGRPVDRLTVSYVVRALAGRGLSHLPVAESSELEALDHCLDQLGEALESSPGNLALKDI